jgi:hypothetical protein
MNVTLLPTEVAALTNQFPTMTVDEALHHVLLDYVKKDADFRLQALATQYRSLTPDLQLEVVALIKQWYDAKIVAAQNKVP